MHKLSIATLLFFTSLITKAQEIKVPAEVKSFILNGYEVLDYVTGDINGDKKTDAILILKQSGEDTATMDSAAARPLLLLMRQANGKLKQVARNDKAIFCRQCGGVFGDPYAATKIIAIGFNLSFYGGSNWRWSVDYRFVYKPLKKNWYLVKENHSNFNAGDPAHTTKNVIIEERELGEVPVEKFDNNTFYMAEGEWKVKAAKTFFYDTPKLGSKPRKDYVIKGKMVNNVRELTNFVEITYMKDAFNRTMGYILKKDLEKVQ